jgi:hypothetical protein
VTPIPALPPRRMTTSKLRVGMAQSPLRRDLRRMARAREGYYR